MPSSSSHGADGAAQARRRNSAHSAAAESNKTPSTPTRIRQRLAKGLFGNSSSHHSPSGKKPRSPGRSPGRLGSSPGQLIRKRLQKFGVPGIKSLNDDDENNCNNKTSKNTKSSSHDKNNDSRSDSNYRKEENGNIAVPDEERTDSFKSPKNESRSRSSRSQPGAKVTRKPSTSDAEIGDDGSVAHAPSSSNSIKSNRSSRSAKSSKSCSRSKSKDTRTRKVKSALDKYTEDIDSSRHSNLEDSINILNTSKNDLETRPDSARGSLRGKKNDVVDANGKAGQSHLNASTHKSFNSKNTVGSSRTTVSSSASNLSADGSQSNMDCASSPPRNGSNGYGYDDSTDNSHSRSRRSRDSSTHEDTMNSRHNMKNRRGSTTGTQNLSNSRHGMSNRRGSTTSQHDIATSRHDSKVHHDGNSRNDMMSSRHDMNSRRDRSSRNDMKASRHDMKTSRHDALSSDASAYSKRSMITDVSIPALYRQARKCLWDDVDKTLQFADAAVAGYTYPKDGTTALHMAVMTLTGYIDTFKSSSKTFEKAPLYIIEKMLQVYPDSAKITCSLNGYTPLTYACLVCSKSNYDLDLAAKIVQLILQYCPDSIYVFTKEGLSAVDIHIVSYSHYHPGKEEDVSLGRTSSTVLRTLLTHNPDLANSRLTADDKVEGPLEFLYKCNASTLSEAVLKEEIYDSDYDDIEDDDGATIMSTMTTPEQRKQVVAKISKWWIYKWAVMILKYGSLKQKTKGARFSAVHTAAMQIGCPIPLLSITLYAFPRQVQVPLECKDELSNYSLHAICQWPCHQEYHCKTAANAVVCSRKANAISLVIEDFPDAAKIPNRRGETALELALISGTTWDGGIKRLLKANPKASRVRSTVTRLYPFMAAAASFANVPKRTEVAKRYDLQVVRTIFGLLRANPQLMAESLPDYKDDKSLSRSSFHGRSRRQRSPSPSNFKDKKSKSNRPRSASPSNLRDRKQMIRDNIRADSTDKKICKEERPRSVSPLHHRESNHEIREIAIETPIETGSAVSSDASADEKRPRLRSASPSNYRDKKISMREGLDRSERSGKEKKSRERSASPSNLQGRKEMLRKEGDRRADKPRKRSKSPSNLRDRKESMRSRQTEESSDCRGRSKSPSGMKSKKQSIRREKERQK